MTEIRAAGLMIFRIVSTKIEYLLLQAANLDHGWTAPKGKLEPGETDLVAAQRETQEESGLGVDDYEIIPGFEAILEYEAWNKRKRVMYWTAKLKNNNKRILISSEHEAYKWCDLPELLKISNKKNMNETYITCDKFLHKKYFSSNN